VRISRDHTLSDLNPKQIHDNNMIGHQMAVSLSKGGNVSLTKEAPGLTAVTVGLGWDTRATDGAAFDLDASVFITGEDGKVRTDADFIFYNNKSGADGSVEHQGDNTTGAGDGDDEQVKVDLTKIPADVKSLVFAVTIHDAEARSQNFGQVSNAFIRVVNQAGEVEIARFDLSEDSATESAMNFGELYRHGEDWKFKAVGAGYAGGLKALAASYGVDMG
jgi:tellurium resistance protein TerD